MAIFISRYKRFSLADEARRVSFENHGVSSIYQTSDEEEIKWLESMPNYKKDFVRTDVLPKQNSSNVITGVRGSLIHDNTEYEALTEKLTRNAGKAMAELLELALKNLAPHGKPRKDANKKELERIKELKEAYGITE